MYQILLYYKYVNIDDPEALMAIQRKLCSDLSMKGRLIISKEGINGTLEGTIKACVEYREFMNKDPRFNDIHWKISIGTENGQAFPKLSVKVRKEIVSLHLDDEEDINPNELTGNYLKPDELRNWYEKNKEFYVVDMRNDYELKVGKFEGTIFPGMKNFRDLKKKVNKIKNLKDKTVLTVCTGGVRCEKASGFLKKEGFNDVYQLDGGIVSYMEKYPGHDFKGSLYVFDQRVTMHFNEENKHEIIGKCAKCQKPSELYRNCRNMYCHDHFICCDDCLTKEGEAYCNLKCQVESFFYNLIHKNKKQIK